MKRHGVGRFVGHATPAVLDPQGSPTLITRLIEFMPRTFMPRAYEEITGMSNQIMSSGLDWTIVRFIAPQGLCTEGPYPVRFFGTDKLGFAITRAGIAAFTADQIGESRYLHRAGAISN